MKSPIQNTRFNILIFLFCLLPIAAFSQTIHSQEVHLNNFERIIQKGESTLSLYYAPEQSIHIYGNQEAVRKIRFYTVDNILFIVNNEGGENLENLRIRIGSPIVPRIEMRGGGSFIVEEGFKPVKSLKCRIEAGGSLDASALQAASVYAFIQDGGNMQLHAETYLKGEVKDGGQISYKGDPEVQRMVAGDGRIFKK